MGYFSIQNESDADLNLSIEPWAELETPAPKAKAEFSFSDTSKAMVDFVYEGVNQLTVSIMARNIEITSNGRLRHYDVDITKPAP